MVVRKKKPHFLLTCASVAFWAYLGYLTREGLTLLGVCVCVCV